MLATREFVANGGGRPLGRRRQSAASPGRTGSRGRVGRRGWWRSEPAASAALTWSATTAGISARRSCLLSESDSVPFGLGAALAGRARRLRRARGLGEGGGAG